MAKQIKEEKKSTTKHIKSKKGTTNPAKEKEQSKKKATKKIQSVKNMKSPPKTKSKKRATKKPKNVEISDEELVMFFQQAEEKDKEETRCALIISGFCLLFLFVGIIVWTVIKNGYF
ncbi:MAG: hypothetical protein IJ419_11935 [Agathobacter sp.]|nr:hypothetical protein [Agathobacter sp.]